MKLHDSIDVKVDSLSKNMEKILLLVYVCAFVYIETGETIHHRLETTL